MLINKPRLNLSYASKGLNLKTLAVHDKKFHADDVLAAMLLRAIYPGLKIVRTRRVEEINQCDIVADVGSVYDPIKLRFDHHQEGKAGSRDNGIEYSAFGLVWKHWGLEVCKGRVDLFKYIDERIVQPVDAQDNGQPLFRDPIFGVSDFNLDELTSMVMNPTLSEEGVEDELFEEAMDLFEFIFGRMLKSQFEVFELKEQILKDYSKLKDKRFMVHERHGPVLKFKDQMPELLFYVFRDRQDDRWLMKTVGGVAEFSNRKSLPEAWAGKEGPELERASGIKGMIFCHNNLFICGADSKEAILEALKVALK